MIKIIVTAFTNTKSTFLINILHGFFYMNEPIYTDTEKLIKHKLITKTYDTNIDKWNLLYQDIFNIYFIGCENIRPYLKKYYSLDNVLIFKTQKLTVSEKNDLPSIIEYVYDTLQSFLPNTLFNVEKSIMLNQAMKRLLDMTIEYRIIENNSITKYNTFYHIHGNKQENSYSIICIIYENSNMYQYVQNVLFSIFLKEFSINTTPKYLSSSSLIIIHKKDISTWKNVNSTNHITIISLEQKHTDDKNEIILKDLSNIAHILSVQIRKVNKNYKPLLSYSKFRNTIIQEKLDILLCSMYESGENEMINYFEKNGFRVKSISFEKQLLYYPIVLNSPIPVIYCYRNVKNAFLSTIQKGRYQSVISYLCNNKNNMVSSKLLLQAFIKQFQNMMQLNNICFVKTDNLNENVYSILCTYLGKTLTPLPHIEWKHVNTIQHSVFSEFSNELLMIQQYPHHAQTVTISEPIVDDILEPTHISLHKKSTPPSVYMDSQKMLFTNSKEQRFTSRTKKHNHIITSKKLLPHQKRKMVVVRKQFFLPF